MPEVTLSTIGFTKRTAETFFEALVGAGVRRVLDVRLNRTSQLAGFAKAADLEYLLRRVGDIELVHLPELAPTDEMLRAYRGRAMSWEEYAARYLDLIASRCVEASIDPSLLADGCLLCSEATADRCHRRLAAEYLSDRVDGVLVTHL